MRKRQGIIWGVLALVLFAAGCADNAADPADSSSPPDATGDIGDSVATDTSEDETSEGEQGDSGEGDGTEPDSTSEQDTGPDIVVVDPCAEGLVCEDDDPCTDNACHPVNGCQYPPKDCSDGNACTVDTCTPGTGACVNLPRDCNDNNGCTNDGCDPAVGCKYSLVACDDGDPCTVDTCAPATGLCQNAPNACSDNDPCTDDVCLPGTGCMNTPKEGPCCVSAADCGDGDACTQDVCIQGQCANLPISNCCTGDADCDTGNACLEQKCIAGKCFGKAVSGPGCCTTAAQCNDNNPCTEDGCADNQCVHQATCCDTVSDCGTFSCASSLCTAEIGCAALLTSPGCCEPNPWSLTFAESPSALELANASNAVGWHFAPAPDAPLGPIALRFGAPSSPGYASGNLAHKGTASTPWFTLPAGAPLVLTGAVKLDVRTQNTLDVVQVRVQSGLGQWIVWQKGANIASAAWQTIQAPISAFGGQKIRIVLFFDAVTPPPTTGSGVWFDFLRIESTCAAEPCESPADCNDGANYTTDICIAETETCAWQPSANWCDEAKPCNDSNPCTQDICVANACVFQPIAGCCLPGDACNDGNPCTIDSCSASGAQPSGVCQHAPIANCCTLASQCNDLNPCTLDSCDVENLLCVNAPVDGCCVSAANCNDNDACTSDTCVNQTCQHQYVCCDNDVDCDDGDDLCTADACVDGTCAFTPTNAPGCCKPELATYKFDGGGESAWTFVNSAGPQQGWQVWSNATSFQSPPGVLYYGNPSTLNYSFGGVSSSGTATSPITEVFAGYGAALQLWARMDTETGSTYDRLVVRVRTGGKIYDIWTKNTITQGQWFEISADLSAFAGKLIQVELFFDTVDSIANETLGVLIDDVRLTSTCTPKTCTTAADCNDGIAATQESCAGGFCSYVVP